MKEDIREVIDLQVEPDESIENAKELYERLILMDRWIV